MAVKMTNVVKQLMYVLKLFRVTAASIHSFRITGGPDVVCVTE